MRRVVKLQAWECARHLVMAYLMHEQLIDSVSGIRKLNGFEIDDLSSKTGGQIPITGNSDLFIDNVIEVKDKKKDGTIYPVCNDCFERSIRRCKWFRNENDSEKTGVMIGSGIGGLDGIRRSSENLAKSTRKISPFFIPSCLINLASGHVSIKYNPKGPNHLLLQHVHLELMLLGIHLEWHMAMQM